MQNLKSKIEGTFIGCAIGDALGLPAEAMKPDQIKRELPNVTRWYHRCPKSHPAHDIHLPGMWSDDTQLTLAVAKGIIRSEGEIVMETLAQEHANAYREGGIMGWGGATRRSVERIINGISHLNSGQEGSAGNGVIMKLSPLSFALKYGPEFRDSKTPLDSKKIDILKNFTNMTHRSVMALVCTAVHSSMLEDSFSGTRKSFKTSQERYSFLQKALDLARQVEAEFDEKSHELSSRFQDLVNNFEKLPDDNVLINISNGGGFHVPETLTMAYGLFASNPPSTKMIYRAVKIGGDTDSNASIVGSMAGALLGARRIARGNLRADLWKKNEIEKVARGLAESLSKK